MLSVYNIKPKFQQLLRPVLRKLHQWGISANAITWAAIVLSFLAGGFFWWKPNGISLVVLPVCLLFRMALNALDGMMAREYNMQSKLGEILNELGDVVADIAMFLPLLKLTGMHPLLIMGFVLLGTINEFTGVLAKAINGVRRYDGPMGKSDRALMVGLLLLTIYCYPAASVAVNYVFGLGCLLLLLSTAIRIKNTLKA
jgi:CDP-diacylglycerol--glycerol-3-phosphate 3-phosphatidyltransferase